MNDSTEPGRATPSRVPCNDQLGLVARLQSLKVLLGTDSPEVRGWAPVVQQGAQATVNAAIAALKQCGGDNCMGRRVQGVTQWVTEQAAEARVAAERKRWIAACQEQYALAIGRKRHQSADAVLCIMQKNGA